MKVSVTLPFDKIDPPGEFLSGEGIVEISQLLERLGFAGGSVTDHPCPTGRWLDHGGHHAQDPFVMLALIGAATRTFKLHTAILVAPYRNPFVTARAVSTLDVTTGGRTIVGVGAGYMKGEYQALGADFDNRNDVTDEYVAAMKAAWSSEEFSFEGTGYSARGARILPLPLQRPHPPIWVGGNSRRAIRRAVQLGDAWAPFQSGPGPLASTARTAAIASDDDIAQGIRYLHEQCEAAGRAAPPAVVLDNMGPGEGALNAQQQLDHIGELERLGVSWGFVQFEGRTRAEWCDNAQRYATEVLAKVNVPEPA